MWIEECASYTHLKVFGCKTFAYVPKEQRLKLDDKVIPCIFVEVFRVESYYVIDFIGFQFFVIRLYLFLKSYLCNFPIYCELKFGINMSIIISILL